MSILNRVKKTEKKTEAKEATKETVKDIRRNRISKDKVGLAISEPLITEKASNLVSLNKYVFKVPNNTTKNEVKKAVEGYYAVNVIDVNMIKTAFKPKRIGKNINLRAGFKKAIVTIKKGETVDLTKSN